MFARTGRTSAAWVYGFAAVVLMGSNVGIASAQQDFDQLGMWSEGLALSAPSPSVDPLQGGVTIDTELVVNVTNTPVKLAHAGDGSGRLFIVEQQGFIRIFDGSLLPTPFLDLEDTVSCCQERGLLGLAFSPNYDVDGFFYVNYTDNSNDTVISRFRRSPLDPNIALPNSEVILKVIDQPFTNHNGGDLAFGPDGMLYSGIGDGGSSGDPNDRAQDLAFLLGKLLRLDVDNPPSYIPADNPFVGDPNALDEIWSYGLRNPWRIAFDRDTDELLIADVGQFTREEVNLQPATSAGGENWGWRVLEGTFCHSDIPAGSCDDFSNGSSELPILEYSHTGGRCSITGGYRYRGVGSPELAGLYFYGDYCTGEIFAGTQVAGNVWTSELVLDTSFLITTFGEDEAGEIYVADDFGGIYHIVGSGTGTGVPCEDIDRFQARCIAPGGANRIQARAILTDASHDGESVTMGIDGATTEVPISGTRANFQQPGAASGLHTVSLEDPAGCFADIVVTCP